MNYSIANVIFIIFGMSILIVLDKLLYSKSYNIYRLPMYIFSTVLILRCFYGILFNAEQLNFNVIIISYLGFLMLYISLIFSPTVFKIKNRRLITGPFFIIQILIINLLSFYELLSSFDNLSWMSINNPEFQVIASKYSFLHLFNSTILLIDKKTFLKFFLLILTFINLFLTLVKGVLFIPLLGSFIFFYLCGTIKLSVRNSLIFGIISFLLFSSFYAIPKITLGEELNILESLNKFATYLFAGIDGFSGFLNGVGRNIYLPNEILIAPFINFLANVTNYSDNLRVMDFVVNNLVYIPYSSNQVNVFTFFGTIFIASKNNLLLFVLINFFIGICINYLFFFSIKKRLYFTFLSMCILLSTLYISFFEYYFWHSFLFYQIIFGIIFDVVTKIKFKINEI